MAIQMRRGAYSEFDPLKMKAGEWAVSTDSDTKKQQIWMCFAPGIVKRMGTVEDFDTEIQRLIQNYLDGMAQSVSQAQKSAELATSKAQESANSASNAKESEIKAKASETNAKTSETSSAKSESEAQKYAEQAKEISESLSGALRPLGTINFADLPNTANATSGDMYNIADQFTTTTDFKEGAGNIIPSGSNVYLTIDRYWDVLAGTPVTGVKGAKEVYYRRGNVNITPTNIGAVAEDGNISDTTVTFTDATTRVNLVSDEKVSVGFKKIKKWFADLKSFAFKDLANNLTTTTTGSALDASQGKILNDKYDELNQSLGNLHLIHLESQRIQGTGYSFSYISYKTGYRLINVIVNYNTSSQGNYRVNTIQYDDTNKVYVVYLNQTLASSSYLVVDLIYMSE